MIQTLVEIEKIHDFPEQGFYSNAYLAFDKRLNRQVAVKDINEGALKSEGDFEKHFEEAYKLSVADHPRVMPVYYVGLDSASATTTPRIVTKHFQKGSLLGYLKSLESTGRTIALDEAIRFAHDIVQGMNHLHSLDIVHLDLKASNILIGDDGKLVIGDFGHAKFIKEGIIKDLPNLYPVTMPPEALKKKAVDKTADIYQFGILLYSIFCFPAYRKMIEEDYKIDTVQLKKIFQQESADSKSLKEEFTQNMKRFREDLKNGAFPDSNAYPFYVPQQIINIIEKCIEPDISKRYNNFLQIQSDLSNFIFPNDVSNFFQDLLNSTIHFEKSGMACNISITEKDDKFSLISKKNGRRKDSCCKSELTKTKVRKMLFTLAEEL